MSVGSSPLTRGKHLSAMFDRSAGGLIPAHAGKTTVPVERSDNLGAHPRSRGENIARHNRLGAHLGSSPLTRGKLRARERLVDRRGLIPAHAGKTLDPASWCGRTWAHPRSRGEN